MKINRTDQRMRSKPNNAATNTTSKSTQQPKLTKTRGGYTKNTEQLICVIIDTGSTQSKIIKDHYTKCSHQEQKLTKTSRRIVHHKHKANDFCFIVNAGSAMTDKVKL
jgi:hypothetical protein